jgi:hypothetical protein
VGRCTLGRLPQSTEEFFHTFAAVVLQEIEATSCSSVAHNARVKKIGRSLPQNSEEIPKGEGTPSKLEKETQPQFPTNIIRLS